MGNVSAQYKKCANTFKANEEKQLARWERKGQTKTVRNSDQSGQNSLSFPGGVCLISNDH